jgi:hypothetical protein
VPQLPVTAISNLPAHAPWHPGAFILSPPKNEGEKGRRGIVILWSITHSVSRHNLQIPLSNPFLHEPMHVHMQWSPLFRSPFGLKLAHSSNLSPNHLPPRYRCGCRPPIIFSLFTLKISLWLSTTDHLRKSADDPTCTNMDREKKICQPSAALQKTKRNTMCIHNT